MVDVENAKAFPAAKVEKHAHTKPLACGFVR